MEIVSLLLPVIALLFSFIYGVKISFKKDGVLFLQIITAAVGCLMLGFLFELLLIICNGEVFDGFNIGMLGIMGSYFFFLSASFDQLDSLGDDKSKELRKYRLISLIFPAVLFILFSVFDILSGVGTSGFIVNLVILILVCMTSYYNFKHLIIPDVEGGILRSIREYNFSMLFTSTLLVLLMIFRDFDLAIGEMIVRFLLTIAYVVKIYHAKKGVEEWFI